MLSSIYCQVFNAQVAPVNGHLYIQYNKWPEAGATEGDRGRPDLQIFIWFIVCCTKNELVFAQFIFN